MLSLKTYENIIKHMISDAKWLKAPCEIDAIHRPPTHKREPQLDQRIALRDAAVAVQPQHGAIIEGVQLALKNQPIIMA